MGNENFSNSWNDIRSEMEDRERRLLAEYGAIWSETKALLHAVAAADVAPPEFDRNAVASLRRFLEDAGTPLALNPIQDFRRLRPQERALAALEVFEEALEDLARRSPASVTVSPDELIAVLGPEHFSGLRAYFLRRRGSIQLPLAALLRAHFLREVRRRAQLDGEFFLLLAKASLELLSPWQDLRRHTLRGFSEPTADHRELEEGRNRWSLQISQLEAGAARILDAMRTATGARSRLTAAVRSATPSASGHRLEEWKQDRQEQFRFWGRRQRAITAVVELEAHLTRLGLRLLESAESALYALDAEHAALLDEIDGAVAWLNAALEGNIASGFPPPAARLVSAADHVNAWRRSAEAAGREFLPASIETIEPTEVLPSLRPPWRHLQPLRAFVAELEKFGCPIVLAGFRQAEAEHRSIVREIERSREVVSFSLEIGRESSGEGPAIEHEGLTNALSLVTYKQKSVTRPRPAVERHFVQGIATVLLSTTARLEQGRLGFLAQFARQSGTRALRTGHQLLMRQLAAAGRWLSRVARERYRWILLKTGWETPPISAYAPVVVWDYLGDVLDLQRGARNLPLIYRRLFRLAPVEDPRFLVARDEEFAAFGHARQLWESNRAVSVLLVGARGSGKTSLMNCAVTAEFSGATVVRSQFEERLVSREAMHQFLRRLLKLPDGEDLLASLSNSRRVIVLEELERTFLRRLNGFEALRELLFVVSRTSRSTLWLLGLNDHSFRFLDAAVGLRQFFSHRINAMAISPEHLKMAILMRHNLSGLRLHYPAVPGRDPRTDRLRRFLGLQQNVEQLFFDSIYQQSQGIFRSAFELWQHYTDRVEGGVLYLKQPIAPEPEPLIAQFTQDDSFTLQAILQHGSLTDTDHAAVFECSLESSRIRLQRLLSLECLEPDPSGQGLRIRPEAGRTVYTALHRLNLL